MSRLKVFIICLVAIFLSFSKSGFCDHATPLVKHLKKSKESYKNKDYKAAIYEAINALYHGRENEKAYYYLGKSYENLEMYIPSIISFMKYKRCCSAANKKKAEKKINILKKNVDLEELKNVIDSIPKRVLISESFYKKKKLFRIRDYLYDPMGRIFEEQFNRPNASYEYRIEYEYDIESGLLATKKKYDDEEKLLETISTAYEKDKKSKEIKKSAAGDTISEKTFKYDMEGNEKEIVERNKKNETIMKQSFVYKDGNIHEETVKDYVDIGGENNYTAEYTYKDGMLASKEVSYSNGVYEKIKYSYVQDKVRKEVYYDNADEPIKNKKYSYDATGYLKEITEYKVWQRRKNILEGKITYKYTSPLSCK